MVQLIPAVDLQGGKCVRLYKGEREMKTVYSNNPVEVALKWQSEAQAAFTWWIWMELLRKPVNSTVISL